MFVTCSLFLYVPLPLSHLALLSSPNVSISYFSSFFIFHSHYYPPLCRGSYSCCSCSCSPFYLISKLFHFILQFSVYVFFFYTYSSIFHHHNTLLQHSRVSFSTTTTLQHLSLVSLTQFRLPQPLHQRLEAGP